MVCFIRYTRDQFRDQVLQCTNSPSQKLRSTRNKRDIDRDRERKSGGWEEEEGENSTLDVIA